MGTVNVSSERRWTRFLSKSEWALMSESDEFLSHPMIQMSVEVPVNYVAPLVFTDERSSLVELLGL